jgi:hypothetical protein
MEAPESALRAFHEGRMTPEDGKAFIEDVQAGRVTVPEWFEMPSAEPAPEPTFADSLTMSPDMQGMDQEPMAMASGSVEAPAPAVKEEAPWPNEIGGTPVLGKEYYDAYYYRNLDQDMRREVEQAIESGEYVLPEGVKLNKPREPGYIDSAIGLISGGDKNEGRSRDLPNVMDAPEMRSTAGFVATTAGTEERAQIAAAQGMEMRKPDFHGRPILYSPSTDQEYTIPAGMDTADALGTAMTMIPYGKAIRGLSAAPKFIKGLSSVPKLAKSMPFVSTPTKLLSAVVRGATVDAGIEALQETVGGDFDPLAPVIGGSLSLAGRLIGKGFEAMSKRGYAKVLVDARNGDQAAIAKAKQLYAQDPEGMKQAADTMRVRGSATDAPVDLRSDPKNTLNEVVRGRGDLEDLARDMQANPKAIEALEANDLIDDIPTKAMIDPKDYRSRELFDAAGLSPEQQDGLKTAGEKIKKIFTDVFKVDSDMVQQSKNIKQFMEGEVMALERVSDDLYAKHLPNIPKDATATAGSTLHYLQGKYEKVKRPTKKGYKIKDGVEQPKALTSFEEEVVANLKMGKQVKTKKSKDPFGVGVKETTLDTQKAPASYFELDRLRKKAGDIIGDTTDAFSNADRAAAKKLYKSLRVDQDAAAQKMLDDGLITKETFDGLKTASDLVKQRKDVEDGMKFLFGKQLAKDLEGAKNVDKMKASKFEERIEALPTEQHKRDYMAGSFLSMFGEKAGKLNVEKFGDMWSQIEDTPRILKMMDKYLPKGSVKKIKEMGEISKAVYSTTKDLTQGATKGTIDEIVNKKMGLLSSILMKGGIAVGSSGLVGVVQKVPGLRGSGSVALSVGLLNTVRDIFSGRKDLLLDYAMDLIQSPELKALLRTDLSKEKIKAASRSKKLIIMARQAGIATDHIELERFLNSSVRAYRD